MADSEVELNVGQGGERMDAEGVDVGGVTRKRSRMQIAGAIAAAIAAVKNASPAATDYGMVARLGGSDQFIGFINPSRAKDFLDGKFRAAYGKATVAVNSSGGLRLRNPVGSGRALFITEFAVGSTVTADVSYWFDATDGTESAVTTFMPHRGYEAAGLTTVGVVKSVLGATNGTMVAVGRVVANVIEPREFAVLLMPGMTVGVRVTNPSLTNTLDVYAGCTWVEPA